MIIFIVIVKKLVVVCCNWLKVMFMIWVEDIMFYSVVSGNNWKEMCLKLIVYKKWFVFSCCVGLYIIII